MEITEVKVFPVGEEKLKAFVSVVIDQCFMVNDIKIIQGRQGLFISMPSRKKKNGEFKDVAHPLNNDTRRAIEARILGEYERVLEERGQKVEAKPRPTPPRPEAPREAPPRAEAPRPEPRPEPEAPAAAAVAPEEEESVSGQTLEEVEELHLRDSFWSVP